MTTKQLSLRQIVSLSLSECRGVWKRFVFFIICIGIGVGAVMTVKSFSNLLDDAIQSESKGLLAADIEIRGSWNQSEKDIDAQRKALPVGTEFQFIKELHAMARFNNTSSSEHPTKSLLIEAKSVPLTAPHYPMYGKLELDPPGALHERLQNQGAVVDPSFLWKTGLKVGDTFDLGKSKVRIAGTLVSEPDRISRAFSIGPRVFISNELLNEADLIQPGSRVKHRTLIRLPGSIELEKAVALLQRSLTDKSTTLRTYKDMESSLTNSIERMGQYLGAVGVIALLMGGIGVAMIIRTFMAQKLDTIAIMNCLGASPRTVFRIYLLQAVLLGLAGCILGIAAGYGLQFSLPSKMAGLLNLSIEPKFYWMPAAQSMILGMATTLLFCVWPLLRAARTKPMRLFRRNFEEEELTRGTRMERWTVGLISLATMMLIVFWQAESIRRGTVFLVAVGVSLLVLAGASVMLLKFLKRLPPPKSMTRRYGLSNLFRPNNQALSIITCLGMGIMLVLTVRLVQMDMLAMLKENTEIDPPNYFFIDIQADQTETFSKTLDSIAPEAERTLTPLVRARIYSADGRKAANWEYKNPAREEWFINREFVLTYMKGPPPRDNEILEGKWWDESEAHIPQVSLEEDAAKRLGATIGSTLIMEIQGIQVSAPVTSIRKVNWRNMRTNFYMIYSPGALEGAPLTFVSTVHVPEEKELELQHAVVRALPNVTALSTRDIVDTVENVVEKLKTLVDFMSGFTIMAGLIILCGSVASTKFRRLKESAVLKVLGASRRRVAGILGVEYVTLGVIASAVGVGLSSALSWAVMKYLVKAPWNVRPDVMAWTLLFAVVLTTVAGVLSSLDVLKDKPLKTLRQLDA